jgi:hypothetical protein
MMRVLLCVVSIVIALSASANRASSQIKAEDGQPVVLRSDGTWTYQQQRSIERTLVLHPNGTWSYEPPRQTLQDAIASFTKPGTATTLIEGATVPYGIWIDDQTWQSTATESDDVIERRFTHVSGEAWGAVIAEPTPLTEEFVKDFVSASARKHMPDADIVAQEKRQVNGKNVSFLNIEGTYNTMPLSYMTYYYVGDAGTIQVYAWTFKQLMPKHEQAMLDFLNGFVVYGKKN